LDIHGNVWEWCSDEVTVFDEVSGRVIRGGSWSGDSRSCRSAIRGAAVPSSRIGDLGFRVAAVLPGQAGQEPAHAAASEPPNP
jgi:formylglycine-generating enzyme required for sulfatase activity